MPQLSLSPLIYAPKGKALEYSPLALNLYSGCIHGCLYCFAPTILRKSPAQFKGGAHPKKDLLARIERQCKKMQGDPRQVLLCFACDPYQPEGDNIPIRFYKNKTDPTKMGRILIDPIRRKSITGVPSVTREALLILEHYRMNATILTKGGTRACRDFDILQRNNWSFGTSINHFFDYGMAEFEPEPCANPLDRIEAILTAKDMGIKTWVSLEPVIYPESALAIVQRLIDVVDHWKIGTLNYMPEVSNRVNWRNFLKDIEKILKNRDYYIKQSLEKYRHNDLDRG